MRHYYKVYNSLDMTTEKRIRTGCLEEADLVSSEIGSDGFHAPLFDIDYPATLVPSSTYGHYHLYLDKAISWRSYKRVLKAMMKAGLIEEGWYKMAVKRKAAFLRAPTLLKEDSPRTDEDVLEAIDKLRKIEADIDVDIEDDEAYWKRVRAERLIQEDKEIAELQKQLNLHRQAAPTLYSSYGYAVQQNRKVNVRRGGGPGRDQLY